MSTKVRTTKNESRDRQDVQYTVRGVPRKLDRFLRWQAKEQNKSLNKYVVDMLSVAAATEARHEQVNNDLDWFFGSWEDDPAFDKIISKQRVVDEKDWR